MDADKLKGMAIVSINEGATLGHIDDLLFDTRGLEVEAFRVKGSGQSFVVPFSQVKNVGADAVTVESSQVAQVVAKDSPVGGLAGLNQIKRLKVVDEAGTLFGTVNSVDVDPLTGRVLSLTARKGGVLGLGGETTIIDGGSVRSVGAEVMTVAQGQATPAAE